MAIHPSHTASPLTEADRRSWRERRGLPEGCDLSPGGRYRTTPEVEKVVLTDGQSGESTRLPARGPLQRTAAAEDGRTVAFVSESPGGGRVLATVRAGEDAPRVLEESFGIYGMDLSPDGSTVAFGSFFDLKVADEDGVRVLGRFPAFIEEVHYLENGSLLVQGKLNSWTRPVPAFWVVDPAGRASFLGDPREAEQLAPGVLQGLQEGYRAVFPMASRSDPLLDQFGYCLPSYRALSEDESAMVFSVGSRFEPRDPHEGTYLIRGERADPVRLEDGPDLLQGRSLSEVVWAPGGTDVALAFGNRVDAYPCVVGQEPTRARLLAFPLARRGDKHAMDWSPSGRYLAMEVMVDSMPAIYCFDTRDRSFYVVVTGSHLEGWEGERLLARRPEQEEALELEPLPGEYAPGQLFGRPLPEKGIDPGVKIEQEHVIIGGVKVPRRRNSP
ncbi:MAG: hypothetical protein AB1758_34970 [Candidatus Eremiobacterota bacterium]